MTDPTKNDTEDSKAGAVQVMNMDGSGRPYALPLDGDSEVAKAYQAHLEKEVVPASAVQNLAETLTHYLAVFREQGIAFDYSAKKCDLHHAATGALFFNQKSYEVVTPRGREKLMTAISNEADVRNVSLMLQAASQTLAQAPRVEKESTVQTKVDLATLISGLAAKAKTPEELAAALMKLIK